MRVHIEIEVLENGYEVTIPDVKAMNEAEAKAKKAKDGMMSMPYSGDFEKSYAAKTVAEVIALVKPALQNLPQSTFSEAFAEAAAEED